MFTISCFAGRCGGINSSIMLWENNTNIFEEVDKVRGLDAADTPKQYQSTADSCLHWTHELFEYLEVNYESVNRVMYKFDHFLEQFLSNGDTGELMPCHRNISSNNRSSIEESTNTSSGVSFCYIQDLFPHKVIDYHTAVSCIDECYTIQEVNTCTTHIKDDLLPSNFKGGVHTHTSIEEALADKCSIICFPLRPKPHELVDAEDARDMAIGQLWKKHSAL